MVALFGCLWAVVTTAACVLAVASRRSALAWMHARRWRKSADDTVEIVRPGLRKAAVYAALVMLALPAGVMAGGSALPGPSAQGSVGLPLTGGTMTGQVVFSGVTTDISTGTNETLTVAPSGTGGFAVTTTTGNVTITTGATTASALKISSSDTSGNVVWAHGVGVGGYILADSDTTAQCQGLLLGSSSSTVVGRVTSCNSAAGANYQGYNVIRTATGENPWRVIADADIGAGTYLIDVGDNGSSFVRWFGVDGNGGIKLGDHTSAHGGTCNSTNEGMFYYRSIAASNKSGVCVCAETSSGVYAWKMGMTFGSSALTDGDC